METKIRLVEVDYWSYDSLIDLKVKESQKGWDEVPAVLKL